MLSRHVNEMIKKGDKGVEELYKSHIKYFNLVDQWAETLTDGDLLDEFELSQCMERLTGCLMKLGSTAGALEAIKEEMEQNSRVKGFSKFEKLRAQDVDFVKAQARDDVSKIRKYATDFRNYFYSAQSSVTTAQSRLKRLTVQKSAKGIDRTGEIPLEDVNNDNTGNPPSNTTKHNTGEKNEW